MKANETSVLKILQGQRQFTIPIYQRTYSWTLTQCRQLWDDVLRVAESNEHHAHFIGSVVYVEEGIYQATQVPRLLVIDGQQRLTTLALMLHAAAKALEADEAAGRPRETISARKIRNVYLFNAEESGALRFKLQLSKGDRETLQRMLDGEPLPKTPSARLVENLAWFEKTLAESKVDPAVLFAGIAKLLVVDISLDRSHDNPQLIFESLNSTGLDLSQADLVRNFVLMGLPPDEQNQLYEQHWYPMEQLFGDDDERADTFDRFLRAWLTIQFGEVPSRREGYEEFKRYRRDRRDRSVREVVADMHRSAEHFAAIALGEETDPDLRAAFVELRHLRTEVALPFLMHAYGQYERGGLSKQDLLRIARLVESWIFRRAVCDIPINVLSRTFATLLGQLDEENLLESFEAALLLKERNQRFPRDDEFHAALIRRNFYDFRPRAYALAKLENHDRKEPVPIAEFTTIEHVLPQNENLAAEWRAMLGDDWRGVRERWLHTLGNLTITGYNSELSDRPFLEKRDMEGGFADSPLRLNRGLAKLDAWDEAAIMERAEALARQAVDIWTAPNVPDGVLERYRKRHRSRWQESMADLELDDVRYMRGEVAEFVRALHEHALSLGLRPNISRGAVGYSTVRRVLPYVFRMFPQRDHLRVRFDVPREEVPDPPPWTTSVARKKGTLFTRARVDDPSKLDECKRILACVLERREGEMA